MAFVKSRCVYLYLTKVSQLILIALRCMDCKVPTPMDEVVAFGKSHKCAKCHSSYRYCSANVVDWKQKSSDSRLRRKHNYVEYMISGLVL